MAHDGSVTISEHLDEGETSDVEITQHETEDAQDDKDSCGKSLHEDEL